MITLRLRLFALFVLLALVVAAVIVFAVQRFSADQVMHLAMETGLSEAEAQQMFDAAVGRVVLIGAGVGVLLGGLAAWWTMVRILRPLARLTDATRAVATGDYAARVPEPPDPELRSLAEAFNGMTDSLRRAESLRRRLVEDVAHELRTPLTSLRGYTEALADGVTEPSPEVLRTLHEEILRLSRLVEQLDDLARGEPGGRAVARRPLDLAGLVDRALELHAADLAGRGIRLEVQTVAPLPVVADPDAIGQVLANLLGNAVRYTDDGGAVTVTVGRSDDGGARVAVANTGTTIPPGELPLIWERLYRVDPSRDRASGGSGIGLAIVREIVEAHGGTVGATSADGCTEVWFTLPAA
ncbi:MAG TPA: ATP-binding protein [Candidatus Limnocylindria bacterium]|nr:ATP-binding protein [Candidatus Limnocylindria bacterium]